VAAVLVLGSSGVVVLGSSGVVGTDSSGRRWKKQKKKKKSGKECTLWQWYYSFWRDLLSVCLSKSW